MNWIEELGRNKKNVFLALNRLLRYKALDMFDAVEIETGTECNRKCSYCPNSAYQRKKGFMEFSLYKKIIDELAGINFNGRFSPHFYNEPLLDKRLPRLIAYARKKLPETFICIYTNGDFLDEKYYKKLIASGADNFFVTQHGKELNPKLKQLISSLKKEEKKNITVRVFGDKGTFVFNRGGLMQLNSSKFIYCSFPSNSIVIDWKGNILLCCNDYFGSHVLGDLKKEKLLGVWNKEDFKKIRRNLRKGIFDLGICRKCLGIE